MTALENIKRVGVVPVVVIEDAENVIETARALLAGGIGVMEITFRTAAAEKAIQLVTKNVPDMCVGAGTIIKLEQCRRAVAAGAKFIVSPGFDEETVAWCAEKGVPITPGCATPTEIMAALRYGISVVKFFPANVYGGLKAMKALSQPFAGVQFIPTGGVNADNLREYLSEPYVYAVGGSWVCTKEEIATHRFDAITAKCRQASNIRREVNT